ncbi:MAG TPA: aldo/keto reductase [Albitalea sp.]|nr:aldo/keto reductase [Albitalea sp.]
MHPRRPLGRSGLEVSPLCFGGNVFGWTADEATSHALLDRCVDAGINFIDSANVYSSWVPGHAGGESESVIGRWLARSGRRADVVIATKVGMDMPALGKGLRRAQIERAVEDSLRRLQTDHIDLYYAHADDADTPQEETLAAFDALVKAGKVRAIGASNFGADRLEAALAISEREGWARYECLQPLYNLADREPFESTLAPVCARHGIAVASFYALASGFLSGKYRGPEDTQGRARGPRVAQYFNSRGQRILDALHRVAQRLGQRPATIAVAWVMSRPTITAAIASATSLAQLEELIAATRLRLDRESLDELEVASAA